MIRALLILTLALTLSACGHRARPVSHPQAAAQFPVTRANFHEAKPVNWAGNPPSTHHVHGVDVSVWQGDIDWPTARANGVNFAFLKATEGADHADPAFRRNWHATAAAGVPRGAYHFFYHCSSAAAQARWFIAHVPPRAGALPPVLDMEWTPRSPTCRGKRGGRAIRADARTYLDAVSRAYGQRPILYTTVDFYQENELWLVRGADFWLRSVAAHPSDSFPGQHWLIWQYSGTGSVPGIAGKVDLNAFAGNATDYSAWLAQQGIGPN